MKISYRNEGKKTFLLKTLQIYAKIVYTRLRFRENQFWRNWIINNKSLRFLKFRLNLIFNHIYWIHYITFYWNQLHFAEFFCAI